MTQIPGTLSSSAKNPVRARTRTASVRTSTDFLSVSCSQCSTFTLFRLVISLFLKRYLLSLLHSFYLSISLFPSLSLSLSLSLTKSLQSVLARSVRPFANVPQLFLKWRNCVNFVVTPIAVVAQSSVQPYSPRAPSLYQYDPPLSPELYF